MKKALVVAYGLISYSIFFGLFLYLVGFLANAFVPITLDGGEAQPFGIALLINAGWILLFGLQHSIMARPAFKKVWTRIIPKEIERSTYVLASSLALAPMLFFWSPMPTVLWDLTGGPFEMVAWGAYAFGWLFLLLSTFMVNHFDLFGLSQVVNYARGAENKPLKFSVRAFYKFTRHPIYVGWLIAMWSTPVMTVGHLVFAGGLTLYILVAVPLEERDLIAEHGDTYRSYKETTPMLIPRLGRGVADAPVQEAA